MNTPLNIKDIPVATAAPITPMPAPHNGTTICSVNWNVLDGYIRRKFKTKLTSMLIVVITIGPLVFPVARSAAPKIVAAARNTMGRLVMQK